MSLRAITWALEQKTGSAPAKLVLIKLADNANDAGKCWPSVEHIVAHTELSERAVRGYVQKLEQQGFIHIERRYSEGVQLPNAYSLNLHQTVGVVHEVQGVGAQDAPGVVHEVHPNPHSKPSIEPIIKQYELESAPHRSKATKEEPEGFSAWYEKFPRHTGRAVAAKAYERALNIASPSELLLGALRYAKERQGRDPEYTKHPSTWLNQGCWTDEPIESFNGNGKHRPPTAHDKFLSAAASLIEDFDSGRRMEEDRDGVVVPFSNPLLST